MVCNYYVRRDVDRVKDRLKSQSWSPNYSCPFQYNSVLTCWQTIINSTASAPPNATKIAVKQVSGANVIMFGPELYFSTYKCCFMACFCASQRVQRLRAELILAVTDGPVANPRPNGTKNDIRMQIHLAMDIGLSRPNGY